MVKGCASYPFESEFELSTVISLCQMGTYRFSKKKKERKKESNSNLQRFKENTSWFPKPE